MARQLTAAIAALCALVVVLLAGVWLGGNPEWVPGPVRSAVLGDDATRSVDNAVETVRDAYVEEVSEEQLIDGLVKSLEDPFSAYFNPEEYARFKQSSQGEFQGVGISVTGVEGGLRVVRVFEDSPARRAGLRPGDLIVRAAGRGLGGLPEGAGAALIKGDAGTKVPLTWVRDGKEISREVERANIEVPVVESSLEQVNGERLGVVSLATFSSGAHAQLYKAMRELLEQGAEGFVLDLRDNGGGLVTEAQLVASAFIAEGPIVTTRGRSVPTQTLKATGDPIAPDLPVVVLVNENSASASEIVTGALEDRRDATVVGEETFGKGVFQRVIELPNGGALDLTAGVYLTPDGRRIGGAGNGEDEKGLTGIKPDVKASDDPDTEPDEALDEALETLAGKL
ncbi:MAG TPA: S41 family peptidase [Solirubrobacteraceae bacterium]|nr:S41 family peptidase [Solirubrobacteraceae bacterium]